MGGRFSDETAKAEYIARMGLELGERFYDLSNELLWAQMVWSDYRALYASQQSIGVLNSSAPAFFWTLENVLWESVFMSLCRLTDNLEVGYKPTLSIQRLPLLFLDESAKLVLSGLVDDALKKTDFARKWRNRRLGHTELRPLDAEKVKPLPEASRQDVEIALDALRAILNRVLSYFDLPHVMYQMFDGGPGGVLSMLHLLELGVKARARRLRDPLGEDGAGSPNA